EGGRDLPAVTRSLVIVDHPDLFRSHSSRHRFPRVCCRKARLREQRTGGALFRSIGHRSPSARNVIEPLSGDFAFAGNLIHLLQFVTLITMGCGDIVPLHPYTGSLANIEAIIGQLYPATLNAGHPGARLIEVV